MFRYSLISLNALLILSVGLFGLATDEPYWRSVGHDPGIYDYLFWLALALNGPSGFLADWCSWAFGFDVDARFLAHYGLWVALLIPQWLGYIRLGTWGAADPTRRSTIYIVSLILALAGCLYAGHTWLARTPTEHFVDVYFWPVRIIGISLSGVVVSVIAKVRSNNSFKPKPLRGSA